MGVALQAGIGRARLPPSRCRSNGRGSAGASPSRLPAKCVTPS